MKGPESQCRFNHSCRPSTEYFWNTEGEVWRQEVRTVRRVARGEELTVCYRSFWPSARRERQELMKQYNFDCCCEGCDVSKEVEEKERRWKKIFTGMLSRLDQIHKEKKHCQSKKEANQKRTCKQVMIRNLRRIRKMAR